MRLNEFFDADSMVTKLVAVSDMLKTEVEKSKKNPDWSVNKLLKYLKKYDIIVDKTDLYDMIKKMPLKSVISNIQGDKVIFKGKEEPEKPADEESKKIVAGMAQKASGQQS